MSELTKNLYWSDSVPVPKQVLARLNIKAKNFSEIEKLDVQENDLLLATVDELDSYLKKNQLVGRWLLWKDTDVKVKPALLELSSVIGVLDKNCSEDTVFMMLRGALQDKSSDASESLKRILEIGRALASEKDLDTLFGLILSHARSLTNADGASIYTRDHDDNKLFLRYWQNSSVGDAAALQKIPVGDDSVAGYVARSGETLEINNA